MTLATQLWTDLNDRWPRPVAAYKFPLTYLICATLDEIRRFLAWHNSKQREQ